MQINLLWPNDLLFLPYELSLSAAEYPDLKEFYKKMYALLDEQFVIKKKNTL